MNIIKKIKLKIKQWFFKFKYRHATVTPQGESFIKYIIDYYINFTTVDQIDRYETIINNAESKFVNGSSIINNIPEHIRPLVIHYHVAIEMLINMLVLDKDKEKWIDYMKNNQIKTRILEILKKR